MNSKKLLSKVLVGTFLITSIVTMSACSKDNKKSEVVNPTDITTSAEKDKDQYLNLFLDNPLTLDPNDARNSSEFQIITQIQEGLARVFTDEKGNEKIEPAGAESWDISEDGLTWTFHLRKHNWSDGKPVVAQHYVDSILRLLDPEKAFSYAFFAYDIKNAEKYYNKEAKAADVGVNAKDDNTLVITLAKAAPQFEKKLAFVCLFPIRLDTIKAGGETWATEYSKQVYNGPFIIKEWIKENSIVLEKNPSYWDAKNVSLQTVNMTIVAEISTKAQLFESKQMDVVEGDQDYTEKWVNMSKDGKFVYKQGNYPSMSFIGFNHKTGGPSKLMNNANIRQAISLSIDREEFVTSLYGRNYPAYSLIPYGIKVGDYDFRKENEEPLKKLYTEYNGNNEKIQGLFKKGLEELGMDQDLSKVTLKFITTGTTGVQKSIQEYWKQTWENKLGVKIDMQVFGDNKVFAASRNKNEYDLLSNGWSGDYNDPMTFVDLWISNSGFAKFFGGYASKEYDAIFAKLDGETDIKKREQIYAELEEYLVVKDTGIVPYMHLDSRNFIHNYVKNLSIPMFGPKYDFSRAYTAGRE
jgi:oligopeptide transport system substrate-binding protein